jgi:hypothetical protein
MEKYFDLNKIDAFLNLLQRAKDKETIESYIYIKNILNSIEFTIPLTIYRKGTKFIRNRVHRENEIIFENVDQLSYRKDIENIDKFGRANEPGQSVFYCSNNEILSFVETSYIAREQKDKDYEYNTTSIWVSTEDILAVSLLTNDDIKGQHTEIDESSRSFENLISGQNDESANAVKSLLQFLSKEFSRASKGNSNHYKITAAFANYIFDSVNNADGILYPSTLYRTEGFNFAFKPDVVENKLQFYAAQRIKMQNMGNKRYQETEKIESEINQPNDNVIHWIK